MCIYIRIYKHMECLQYLILYSIFDRVIECCWHFKTCPFFSCTCFWTDVLDADWVFWSTSLGQRLLGWEVDGTGADYITIYNHVQHCPFCDWHLFYHTFSAYTRLHKNYLGTCKRLASVESRQWKNPLKSLLPESLKYDNASRLLRRLRFDYDILLVRPKPSWQNSGRQNRHCSTLRATQRGRVEVISSQHAQHAKVLNCHDWPISVAWGQTIPAHSDYERLHRRRCNPSSNGGFFRFKRLGQPGRPSRRAWRRTACCLTPKILRSRHGEYPITRRRKAGTNRFWKITAALAWSAILSFLQR